MPIFVKTNDMAKKTAMQMSIDRKKEKVSELRKYMDETSLQDFEKCVDQIKILLEEIGWDEELHDNEEREQLISLKRQSLWLINPYNTEQHINEKAEAWYNETYGTYEQ